MWKLPAMYVGNYAERDAELTFALWKEMKNLIPIDAKLLKISMSFLSLLTIYPFHVLFEQLRYLLFVSYFALHLKMSLLHQELK